MNRDLVTFRLDTAKKEALDAIATSLNRDRSYVLNEAISAYLDVNTWQIAHIEEGLRQADAGKFASASEVSAVFRKWRK